MALKSLGLSLLGATSVVEQTVCVRTQACMRVCQGDRSTLVVLDKSSLSYILIFY